MSVISAMAWLNVFGLFHHAMIDAHGLWAEAIGQLRIPQPPDPLYPPNVENKFNQILGYLQGVSVYVIAGAGILGIAGIAGGRYLGMLGLSKTGLGLVLAACGGALLTQVVPGLLDALSK